MMTLISDPQTLNSRANLKLSSPIENQLMNKLFPNARLRLTDRVNLHLLSDRQRLQML